MKYQSIVRVKIQGACGGVRKAIETARQVRRDHPEEKVTVLGELVHNRFVMEDLAAAGICTVEGKGRSRLELLDEIRDGLVVFTAHGVSDDVRMKAQRLGLTTVDASCPFVLSTQKLVRKKLADGYAVFYIGKQGHPEAEAVYTSSDQVYLVTKQEDIPAGMDRPVFVTNQTTMSVLDIQDLFEAIRSQYPNAEFHDEICSATRLRQEAVLALKDTDVLIVIGDPLSNNTRQLEAVGKKAGIPQVIRAESAEDLHPEIIPAGSRIAVTSGASTPGRLVDEVIRLLEAQ
ncbi:4-hydroxy-3-methylbut-2-enyl diphosphate reductase [Faecalibaculum rodentium]|uniref:4-hydroxy-3-methylbut-2-enyl diphosphate reductase n=2 Tax=Faecalibaculum rodentium TaxID=1702221 RepID=A0A1Q9YML7_9FIRM|nr:4-hydroxy-3-methylbut-2-enyl diphosphate reductase [Faecalibaculum rodentium]